jgi:hypothetical protein
MKIRNKTVFGAYAESRWWQVDNVTLTGFYDEFLAEKLGKCFDFAG